MTIKIKEIHMKIIANRGGNFPDSLYLPSHCQKPLGQPSCWGIIITVLGESLPVR